LLKRGLQIFDDFLRDDVGIRKIGAVFEAWKARPLLHPRYGVFEPESVEVRLAQSR
jgi:hypothetical protein